MVAQIEQHYLGAIQDQHRYSQNQFSTSGCNFLLITLKHLFTTFHMARYFAKTELMQSAEIAAADSREQL